MVYYNHRKGNAKNKREVNKMENFSEYIKTLNDKERKILADAFLALEKDAPHLLSDSAMDDAFWMCLLGPERSAKVETGK